jgi:LPS-assembly lipoprotein
MSSFSRLRRAALLSLAVAGVAMLSACTFGPVYEDQGAAQAMEIGLAPPSNPLEQIVYQELQRRFGVSSNPGAPQVSVTVSTASRALAQSVTADPSKDSIMTATGVLRITRDGQPVLTTTRQATATYSTQGQVLGDKSAETAAAEQAATALAQTLELTIMSKLAPAPAAQ